MAQHADPTKSGQRKPGPRPKYQWDTWMDGEWWRLSEGDDYKITTISFRSIAHSHGARHGYRLHTQLADDGIFIRFVKRDI